MTTPIAGIEEIAQNQANKYATHNEALRDLEALMFRAISNSTAAQPTSPAPNDGDVYILPASPTGADWGAYVEGDVAVYNSGWKSFTPWEGLQLWVNDLDQHAVFDGAQWQTDRIKINGAWWIVGDGSPEGVVTAPRGSIYTVKELGSPEATSILYVKESNNSPNNTGWVGK